MPKPKNRFTNGKFGISAAASQYDDAISQFLIYMESLNAPLFREALNYRDQNARSLKNQNKEPEGIYAAYTFDKTFDSKKDAENKRKKMKDLKSKLDRFMQNPTPEAQKIKGYLATLSKMLDTDSGDFGRAMTENAYLSNMLSMFRNGPKNSVQNSLPTTLSRLQDPDPQTGVERGPLIHLNNYFRELSKLIDLEYEKQRLEENYSKEAELSYLQKLAESFGIMIENHKAFDEMVGEDGKSKYDDYLMQKLDIMTGKNPLDSISRPGCSKNIANITGQYTAIQKGWGAFDLDLPGKVFELSFLAEKEKQALKAALNPQKLQQRKEMIEQRIQSAREHLDTVANEVKEAKQILDTLINSNAAVPDIEAQKETVKEREAAAERYIKELDTALKDREAEPSRVAKLREQLKKQEKLSDELKKLERQVKETQIDYASDKYAISDKFMEILQTVREDRSYDEAFKKEAETAFRFAKKAMSNAGRNPLPEAISEEAERKRIKPEEYEVVNSISTFHGAFTSAFNVQDSLARHGRESVISLINKSNGSVEEEEMTALIAQAGNGFVGKIDTTSQFRCRVNYRDDPELINDLYQSGKAQARILRNIHRECMEADTGLPRDLARLQRVLSKNIDDSKGNLAQALAEQPFLPLFFTTFAGAPNFYRPQAEKVKTALLENNALEPLLKFYEDASAIMEAEFAKQKMSQSGWDEKKEKIYLAKLHEGAKKTMDSFARLEALPQDFQKQKHLPSGEIMLDNEIGHFFGNTDGSSLRDLRPSMSSLVWLKRGIENGWDSQNLVAFQAAGFIEGEMIRLKNKLERSIESVVKEKNLNPISQNDRQKEQTRQEKENDFRRRLSELKDWEEKQFKPFKERLFNRKINTSLDKLRSLTEIRDFLNKHVNDRVFTDVKWNGVEIRDNMISKFVNEVNQYLLPNAINRCLKGVEEERAQGIEPFEERKPEVSFTICNKNAEMKELLKLLSQKDNLENDAKIMIVAQVLSDRFLHGMNQEAHPEYFDTQNTDYITVNRKLHSYMEQYSERLITVFENESNEDLADLLENGNFEELFSDVRERVDADAARARMDAFVKGKPVRKDKDVSLLGAIKQMENSHARWGSSSGLYDEIVGYLKGLEKSRVKFSEDLKKKYYTDFKSEKYVNKEGEEDTKYILPEDVTTNEKKYAEFVNRHGMVLEDIDRYLEGKRQIIRERGGDPNRADGAAKLGANGERRYKAMQSARNALINEYLAAKEFGNSGPSDVQRKILQKDAFLIQTKEYFTEPEPRKADYAYDKNTFDLTADANDPTKYNAEEYNKAIAEYNQKKEDAYKKFALNEKNQILEFAKYNVTVKLKDCNDRIDQALKEEEEVRRRLIRDNKTGEETFINSAKKSLFLESVKEKFIDRKKEILKETYREMQDEAEKEYRRAKATYEQKMEEEKITHNAVPEEIRNNYETANQRVEDLKNGKEEILKKIDAGIEVREVMKYVKLGSLTAEIREYNKVLNQLKINGAKEIEKFDKEILQKDPFKENFGNQIRQQAREIDFDRYSIGKVRDKIVKNSLEANKGNRGELEKLGRIAAITGSKIKINIPAQEPIHAPNQQLRNEAPVLGGPR